MDQEHEFVETGNWRLRAPTAPALHRTVCVPTIHPIGDRRVLRCAQAVLDAGFDVHFVWLGGAPGEHRPHPRIRETCLPEAMSFTDRIRAVPAVARQARELDADLWHIHDFYFLPSARRWAGRTGRPVLYDVHEYYPEYYSHRIPAHRLLQPVTQRLLTSAEEGFAARLGGVNAVSEALAQRFRAAGVPAIATPNFPSDDAFRGFARPLTTDLLHRVVHTGTLTSDYGSELIVELAGELARIAPGIEVLTISRFPSRLARSRFFAAYRRAGSPANLRLVDPMPAHEVGRLLAGCGIGLSMMQDRGEAPLCVNTKLYEYATIGLAVVASDLPATRNFVESAAIGRLARPDRPAEFARAIVDLVADGERTCAAVNALAPAVADELSWDQICAPRIQAMVRGLTGTTNASERATVA